MHLDYPCQRRPWPGADARDPRNLLLAKEYRADAAVGGRCESHRCYRVRRPGALRDGGRIATVRGFKGKEDRGITFHPVTVRSYAREHAKLENLRRLAETGELTLRVARVLPAERAAEAHRILEAGGTRGRLVLEF